MSPLAINSADAEPAISVEACPVHVLPDVKGVLLQLLSSHPSDLHVDIPNLNSTVDIAHFLGHGATNNVYKALKDGQQVIGCQFGLMLGA